jgi:hypothetical protein
MPIDTVSKGIRFESVVEESVSQRLRVVVGSSGFLGWVWGSRQTIYPGLPDLESYICIISGLILEPGETGARRLSDND